MKHCKHVFAFAGSDDTRVQKEGVKCSKCTARLQLTPEGVEKLAAK